MIQGHYNRSLLLLPVFVIVGLCLSCTNEDKPLKTEWKEKYDVELQVVIEGFNGTQNWFQPRVAWTGKEGEYSLIMQPWYFSISDYFGIYHEMHSYDGGTSWHSPISLEDSLGDKFRGDTLIRIADVNTQYHSKSRTILGVGGICEYLDGLQFTAVRHTCYFSYSPVSNGYSSYKVLRMPSDSIFMYSYPGCSQWVELPNGDILQPFRMWDDKLGQFYCTVARCSFDGNEMQFKEYGNILKLNRGRGLYEPSLIEFGGVFYLTLRNDVNGLVTYSKDGLHYNEPVEWKFDTGELINSENTQQHWVKSPWGLYLIYTSSKRPESENVFRGRAPLFIARFDENKMCLIKSTEQVLIPNTGAQLGNFGAFDVDQTHSWVITSEATTPETLSVGGNNGRVYIAKITWY